MPGGWTTGKGGKKIRSQPKGGGGGTSSTEATTEATSNTPTGVREITVSPGVVDFQPEGRLGRVTSQEDFNERMTQLITNIDREHEMGGLVPIYMLRRASPDLSRSEFDGYMRGFQSSGRATHLESSYIPSSQPIGRIPPVSLRPDMGASPINEARFADGWRTPMGATRMYTKLNQ